MKLDFMVMKVVETKGVVLKDSAVERQLHFTDIYLGSREAFRKDAEVRIPSDGWVHLQYDGAPKHETGQTLRLELGGDK